MIHKSIKNILMRPNDAGQESQERLEVALKTSRMETWDFDTKTGQLQFSEGALRLLGLGPLKESDLANRRSIIHVDDQERVFEGLSQSIRFGAEEWYAVFRIHNAKSGLRWISCAGKFLRAQDQADGVKIIGVIRDITEEKSNEEVVSKQAVLLKQTQLLAKIGSWEYSLATGHLSFTDECIALFGLPLGVFYDRETVLRHVHQDEVKEFRTLFSRLHLGEGWERNCRIIRDAETMYMRVGARPICESEKLVGVVGFIQDVTKETTMLKEIRNQHQTLDLVIKAANVSMWTWNVKEQKLTTDREWSERYATDDTEESWIKAIHPEDVITIRRKLDERLRGKSDVFEMILRLRLRDGSYKHFLSRGRIVQRDEGGAPIALTGVHVDLTETMLLKQQIEDQRNALYHTSHLSALGTMASGITHEINNSLNYVYGSLGPLSRSVDEIAQNNSASANLAREYIGVMRKGLDITIDIIKNLRGYVSGGRGEFREIQVAQALETCLSILRSKLSDKGITVINAVKKADEVYADPAGINQIFMNLIGNASDASPKNSNIEVVSRYINHGQGANWYEMTVRDHGAGISEDLGHKIWEPFFSTKESDSGTGLGLFVVKREVEKHFGQIIYRTSANGTDFVVTLPADEPTYRAELNKKSLTLSGAET